MTEPAAPATATEARAVLDARMADKDWGSRVFNGDPAANKELRELTAQVAAGGEDVVAAAMSGELPDMPTGDQRIMAGTAEMLRELGIRDEVTANFLRGEGVTPQEYELVANWKREHMGDAEWTAKFLSGDVKARQQMMLANSVLVNGIKSEQAA